MPETAKSILEQINSDINSYESLSDFGALVAGNNVGTATPLFARIDAEKFMADIEAQQAAAKEMSYEETLNDVSRQIFIKRYFYMLPIKQISVEMKFSVSNIKVTLMRTREKFKDYLEKAGISI